MIPFFLCVFCEIYSLLKKSKHIKSNVFTEQTQSYKLTKDTDHYFTNTHISKKNLLKGTKSISCQSQDKENTFLWNHVSFFGSEVFVHPTELWVAILWFELKITTLSIKGMSPGWDYLFAGAVEDETV